MNTINTVHIGGSKPNNDAFQVSEKLGNKIALIPIQQDKVLAYRDGSSRGTFEPPEYDFNEILTVEDTESYVARANEKKSNLMFKEGWDIVSKNPDTQLYINKRVSQLARAQNKPWDQLLRETAYDLFRFSNAMWVKVRDREMSGGFPRTTRKLNGDSETVEPIAAYFLLPMETVEIKRDKQGKVVRIRQVMPDGRTREWALRDVVHFYINKKTGWAVGTPGLIPVIDDIRTLRRIEENVDLLVYQNLFPLFQYKVGTPERPAQTYPDGTTEIDLVRAQVSYMPPEGVIVTPERHEIEAVGSEGRALRAENYLEYFRLRVFAGLQMSTVDYGQADTSNKSTAEVVSDALIDNVKAVQQVFETQFNFLVLDELLMEGKFDYDPLEAENAAQLRFREIDINKKIKMEEHAADIYTKHLINEDEARMMTGREVIEEEDDKRRKSYFKLIEEPMNMLKGAGMSSSPLAAAAGDNMHTEMEPEHVAEGQKNKEKEIKARPVAPKAPAKKKSTNALVFSQREAFKDHLISSAFSDLLNDVTYHLSIGTKDKWLQSVIDLWSEKLISRFMSLLVGKFKDGIDSAGGDRWSEDFTQELTFIETNISSVITRLSHDVESGLHNINPTMPKREIMSELDITMNRINAIYITELYRAYNIGRLTAFKKLGISSVRFGFDADTECNDCKQHLKLTFPTHTVTINQVPPHHPYCRCTVESA